MKTDFGRSIQRRHGIRVLADRGRPYQGLVEQPDLARLALQHVWDEPVLVRPNAWTMPAGAFGDGARAEQLPTRRLGRRVQRTGRAPFARPSTTGASDAPRTRRFPLERRDHRTAQGALGGWSFDRRNRPPPRRQQERRYRKIAPAQAGSAAVADPKRRIGTGSTASSSTLPKSCRVAEPPAISPGIAAHAGANRTNAAGAASDDHADSCPAIGQAAMLLANW
jgi:hypothetical protein